VTGAFLAFIIEQSLSDSGHLLQASVETGPFGDQILDFRHTRYPSGNPDMVIDEQCRRDINPIVDHFPAIPEEMDFSLNPGIGKSFTDVVFHLFTLFTAFRPAKNVYAHGTPFL
jgi:hypothetical protein